MKNPIKLQIIFGYLIKNNFMLMPYLQILCFMVLKCLCASVHVRERKYIFFVISIKYEFSHITQVVLSLNWNNIERRGEIYSTNTLKRNITFLTIHFKSIFKNVCKLKLSSKRINNIIRWKVRMFWKKVRRTKTFWGIWFFSCLVSA